jgi:hypothetical protein
MGGLNARLLGPPSSNLPKKDNNPNSMSTRKQKFLHSISTALGYIHPHVETDSPYVTAASIAASMSGAELWFHPRYVDGFNPDDFPELSVPQRQELVSSVEAFKNIAAAVPNCGPATREQSDSGLKLLNQIYMILKPSLVDIHALEHNDDC